MGRIAVRYINRLALPLPCDFDEYLTAGPKIPQALPQHVLEFFSRTSCPRDPDIAIVTQGSDGTRRDGNRLDLLLDIDVFHLIEMPAVDESALFGVLNRLREIKNEVFFGSLTERCLESYK